MASSGDHGAAAKHLRVLLPFTCNSLVSKERSAFVLRPWNQNGSSFFFRSQRIPDDLAEEIGAQEALVIDPAGGKSKVCWRVEVGRDGDGAFLGPGWPELADACGVGAGWLLVLRHRGRGVLTLKAFDDDRCLRNLGALAPPAGYKDSGFFIFFFCRNLFNLAPSPKYGENY